MTTGRPEAAANSEARLLDLLAAWYAEVDAGRRPRLAELCAAEAELLPRLAALIEREAALTGSLSLLAPNPSDDASLPFARLGEFRLIEALGEGGMGRVFLAEQEPLGRLVALKILRETAAVDPRVRLRFRREAEITAALEHPGIVPIYAVGEERGLRYIAMKYLGGRTLAQVESPGPVAVATWGAAVARALHEAHLSGVIHRDVKPSNILLDGESPVLVDFGLARAADDLTLTRSDAVPGTLLYIAPEALRGRTPPDPRLDVYSLGATLYHLAAGRVPFESDEPQALVRDILLREPPHFSRDAATRDLETVIRRAMDKDPRARFPTAADLAEDLERYLRGEAIVSRRVGLLARAARVVRRHRVSAVVVGILGLVVTWLGVAFAVHRVDVERTLAKNVVDAGAALHLGEPERARTILAALDPAGLRDPRVVRMLRRCEGMDALDSALDAVLDALFDRAPSELERLLRRLEGTGGDELAPPLSDYARAVLLGHLGRSEEAIRVLEGIGSSGGATRAALALGDWVTRGEVRPAAELPAPPPGGDGAYEPADEHVFAALALRLGDADPARQRSELEAALALSPGQDRARQALGRLLHTEGEYVAALEVFRGIQRHGRHRPAVLARMAQEAVVLGRLREARGYLDRIPGDARDGRYDTVLAHLLRRSGDAVGYREHLAAALERWPDSQWLVLLQAYDRLEAGDFAPAGAAVTRVLALRQVPAMRDRARLLQLTVEFAASRWASAAEPADVGAERTRLESWREAARDLAVHGTGDVRSDSWLLASRLARVLGDRREAWEHLQRAVEADPLNPSATLRFVTQVGTRCFAFLGGQDPPEDVAAAGGLAALLVPAREYARRLADAGPVGLRTPRDSERETAILMSVVMAFVARDWDAFDGWVERFMDEAPSLQQVYRGHVEEMETSAERFR